MKIPELTKAWHEGYDSFNSGDISMYEKDTSEQDDFDWGYSCAISDEESYRQYMLDLEKSE